MTLTERFVFLGLLCVNGAVSTVLAVAALVALGVPVNGGVVVGVVLGLAFMLGVEIGRRP